MANERVNQILRTMAGRGQAVTTPQPAPRPVANAGSGAPLPAATATSMNDFLRMASLGLNPEMLKRLKR